MLYQSSHPQTKIISYWQKVQPDWQKELVLDGMSMFPNLFHLCDLFYRGLLVATRAHITYNIKQKELTSKKHFITPTPSSGSQLGDV